MFLDNLVVSAIEAPPAPFNIFKWKYINPGNPSLGKQQSTTLTHDGYGVHAEPGLQATGSNLANAYLGGANLTNASFNSAILTRAAMDQANLTGANLSGANLNGATLTDAILTDAIVKNAKLSSTHITLDQLYSTASYKNHDLTGVQFVGNDLSGANFAGQGLAAASFYAAKLVGADFDQCKLDRRRARQRRLIPSQPHGRQLHQRLARPGEPRAANLTNANFSGANLIGTNLTGADIARSTLRPSYHVCLRIQVCGRPVPSAVCSSISQLTGVRLPPSNIGGGDHFGATDLDGQLRRPTT